MTSDSQRPNLRGRYRWRRWSLCVVLVFLPVAILEWPWSFIPLRWQYREIGRTGEVVGEIEELMKILRRLPTRQELMDVTKDPHLTNSLNYEPMGTTFQLTFICGFDCAFAYDSREGRWK